MAEFIVKGGRELKFGYTTGSCATAAASAAAEMLLSQRELEQTLITLPRGEQVVFTLENVTMEPGRVSCSVIKDAGDDPDVTDGLAIVATCELAGKHITLKGGEGIGVVAADGLSVPRGEAAINRVPRQMITSNLQAVCERYGYRGGLVVTIAAPGGEVIARKTFNPRLGIVGGISILGTTGIVEPMSEQAIVETVKLLIDKRKLLDPEAALITPGNYGRSFIADRLGIDMGLSVKYGNFLGECLDYLAYKKFKRVLLVGHFGKLVKVAGGIMQTHSSMADCRMEIITAHAACAGANRELVQELMQCPTTDAAITLLENAGLAGRVYASLLERMLFYMQGRLEASWPEYLSDHSPAHVSGHLPEHMSALLPGDLSERLQERLSSHLHEHLSGHSQEPLTRDSRDDLQGHAPEILPEKLPVQRKDGPRIELIVFSQEAVLMQTRGAEALVRHFLKEGT